MKYISALLILSLLTTKVHSQNNAAAIGLGAGLIAGGIAAYATVNQMEEGLEQQATEWFLANRPDIELFQLKIKNTSGTKLSDLSNVSCMLYTVISYDKATLKPKELYILLSFHIKGWVNEYGVDFKRVSYKLFSKQNWESFVKLWIETISPQPINWDSGIPIYARYTERNSSKKDSTVISIANNTSTENYIKTGVFELPLAYLEFSKSAVSYYYVGDDGYPNRMLVFPIQKFDGDTYIRSPRKLDFIDATLVGNEKTICFFLEDDKRLVQLDLDLVNSIQEFFRY